MAGRARQLVTVALAAYPLSIGRERATSESLPSRLVCVVVLSFGLSLWNLLRRAVRIDVERGWLHEHAVLYHHEDYYTETDDLFV